MLSKEKYLTPNFLMINESQYIKPESWWKVQLMLAGYQRGPSIWTAEQENSKYESINKIKQKLTVMHKHYLLTKYRTN